jgi:hypothetical protein
MAIGNGCRRGLDGAGRQAGEVNDELAEFYSLERNLEMGELQEREGKLKEEKEGRGEVCRSPSPWEWPWWHHWSERRRGRARGAHVSQGVD